MSKPTFSSLFSASPKEYASRFSQEIKKAGSGKAEKSNDANKKSGIGDADTDVQVSLVSPLKNARRKKEKLRVFSKVRLVPDGPTAKRARSHSKPVVEAGAEMKSAHPKSVSRKKNAFLKKLRNFLQKNGANAGEHSGATETAIRAVPPSKRVCFQVDEQSAGSSRTSSSTTSAARPGDADSVTASGHSDLSQREQTGHVDTYLEVSKLRETDDVDRFLDELEKGSSDADAENPSDPGKDRLLSDVKNEVEEIDRFLSESGENKTGGGKSGITQEELTAFIQTVDQALQEVKRPPAAPGKAPGGRNFQKTLDDLKALHDQVQHDLAEWEKLSSQLAGNGSGSRDIRAALDEMKELSEELEKDLDQWDEFLAQPGSKDWAHDHLRDKMAQKKPMELQIARDLKEVQKMLAEAEEKMRVDAGGKVGLGKPGSGSK